MFFSDSSTFRLLMGTSTDCGTVSFNGVLAVVDADSACSSRTDLPQFMFSNSGGMSLSGEIMFNDTFFEFSKCIYVLS